MDDRLVAIFDATIRMERKCAEFYRLLDRLFPVDGPFWLKLMNEEEHHAILFQAGMERFFDEDLFPLEAMDPDLTSIQKLNSEVESAIRQYTHQLSDYQLVRHRALQLESSSGEFYFELALASKEDSPALWLFRDLCDDEHDHRQRILDFFNETRHS
ncbi:MAG TPA: hypothetical protein VLX68_14745 [Chitinivibrionales bacterium]|nr:hypothetical protein [Chitinivibrionales bacterium]